MARRRASDGASSGRSGEEAAWLAAIVDSIDDAVIGQSPEGRITSWNGGAERLYGYSGEEAIGEDVSMLAPEERAGEPAEIIERVAAGERVEHFETTRVRRDGSPVRVSLTVSAVREAGGELIGVSSIARDMTEGSSAEDRFAELLEFAPDAILGVDPEGKIRIANSQAERMFGYTRPELLAGDIEMLVPERFQRPHLRHRKGYFEQPRTRPMGAGLDLHARRRDGTEFPCEISLSAIETGGTTIALAAVRDVSERRRAEEEMRRALRRLEATTDVLRAVGGETDLSRVLDTILERGLALVEAGSLVILLEEGEELVVAATAGDLATGARGERIDRQWTIAGMVESSPVRLAAGTPSLLPELLGAGGASAALLVPLIFRGSRLGIVAAFDRRDGPEFSDDDERLLEAFAASAATAVATAKSVAEDRLQDALEASEQERGRWARELHDETLQGMAALRVMLSSGLKAKDPERARSAAGEAVEQLAVEIEKLRSLITELRPAALDDIGLGPALEALADRSASLEGIEVDCHVRLREDEELARVVETTIYRLVQEGLTNIAKHARAERVTLRVGRTDAGIEVTLRDDGVGFEPDVAHDGFGLVGMGERVSLVGGELAVRSSPGTGTTLAARIPPRGREQARGDQPSIRPRSSA